MIPAGVLVMAGSWSEAKEIARRTGMATVYHDLDADEYGACAPGQKQGHFAVGKFVEHRSVCLPADLSEAELIAKEREALGIREEAERPGDIYTVGRWTVKPGNEPAFIGRWKEFAEWTIRHQPGALEAILLQDLGEVQRFISFSPWEDALSVEEWRGRPEFQNFMAQARELCDEIVPGTMKRVAP
ncbi:MAG: antibiotic biosynthesis monooxygenase [Methanomicrobiaceae archaeon]|nr:antibiotic biosynthesis monooxygenase [Methanomicrobiaceae archaeon]MDD5418761.1 antibiotic biosynthesis monooxygenase [Methanomicrobiaceae archaeon]